MKRYFFVLLGVLLIVGLFTACASAEPLPTPVLASTPEPTPLPTPEPTLLPTTAPEDLSYTTGLPYKGEYRPVMAVIDNHHDARPQLGLQTADIVYEMPIESSFTRFICVFSDNVPEEVMPIRSGRVSFLYLQQEWDAPLMHWGGSGKGMSPMPDYTFYGNGLYDKNGLDLDGLYDHDDQDLFHRSDEKERPHNVVGNAKLAQQRYDAAPEPLVWLFDSNAAYSGADVAEIKLPMCSHDDDFVSYKYDAAQDVYLRFMDGKEFKSAETGEQVKVKNIIVQYSTYESRDVYKIWKMTGGGSADIYIGGKLIKGTWEKESAESQTFFYDDKGDPIVLRPGNTWIHFHPET